MTDHDHDTDDDDTDDPDAPEHELDLGDLPREFEQYRDTYRLVDPGVDAPSEADTERDGFLSYSAELHAFTRGIYDGLKTPALTTPEMPDIEGVRQEPHYWQGGYILGTLAQLALLVAAVEFGLPLLT